MHKIVKLPSPVFINSSLNLKAMTELKDSNRESAFNIAYYDYTVTKDLVPKKGHFPLCLCRSDMEFPDKIFFF